MTTAPPNGSGRSPGLPSLDRLPGLIGLTVSSDPAPIFAETVRRTASRPAAPARTEPRPADLSGIDWALVYRIRYTVAERLANAAGPLVDEATRLQIGRDMIPDIVKEHSDNAVLAGDRENQIANRDFERYRRAVDSAIFGYGRWQSLMDDPEVENIEIRGHDQVFMVYADRIVPVAPVADSDAELIEQLQFITTYSKTPKPFSEAHPEMTLNLEDRFRLHAEAYSVVDRPSIVIRQHTFAGVPLERLCELGMFPPHLVGFLAAAIRARQSVVISGNQGVGKALALDTLVPTPSGWSTMGDLRRGDRVFDETGKPATVLAAHDVQEDRPCYRVTFDDKTEVVADADHLWRVSQRAARERERQRYDRADRISVADREELLRLAEVAAESPDREVTVTELVAEVGEEHRAMLGVVARQLGPVGHVKVSWTAGKGARTSRDVHTYSRQLLLKTLAERRSIPDVMSTTAMSVVLTTREMAESGLWSAADKAWRTHDYAIELALPLEYPRKEQFIDPYVLGAWLGDGTSATARITSADAKIIEVYEAAGYPCRKLPGSKYDYAVGGSLQTQLRHAGVLGDKHIPSSYRFGDVEQRLALLQGLMDTDGTCNTRGACQYDSTSRVLAEQVYELACSLGYRATITDKLVQFKGRPCGRSYRIHWTTSDPMFRLPRKLGRQSLNCGGPKRRYITAIEPVDSVPVRCITVDSPSSLFLVGRSCIPTHNTTFLRALAMAMDPLEAVGVIETDAELFLHKLPGRGRTVNYVARGASGEGIGADGQPLGQFSVQRHLTASLRQNLSRIIVGEVRDAEAAAMFQAMQSGAGSLSTIHAQHAEATIERLVTAAALGGVMTQVDAYRQIAVNINLIVHLGAVDERSQGGKYRRFVNEITEIDGFADTADGTSFMPATNSIYQVTDPHRPLDLTMSDHMKNALAAHGWKP